MNVITLESEAYQELIDKIDTITQIIESLVPSVNLDEAWISGEEVCSFLHISNRSLQRLRSSGNITYSTLAGKNYYSISEIKRVLENRKIRSRVESVDGLCDAYRERLNKLNKNERVRFNEPS